ncbi:MAG: phenylacetate-CoA oxygenase subunit PaaJ [Bacteroidetes bacterium]|uniref:Phenylacetate-CoA oxygenase subunit PaaJ n=1 Tax=Phaeocystidibacter marisrubri TaxID=1577780 RepID=A0A6L3ZG19_9FLAO|nr:1,2-phenylacetyl-CoA epoxidase subunit PaaD [Phaeocystidibacter marisrubri]KAB2816418.1 phenylacetate-CoA oxygenase subunit PaaJ [Phaeocystidibacter marisrubri]TNE29561.1 MAG: phenylacetate-CoA oxygenase subunit PaaJ [Bacteroidota bacterium]GGH68960.1 phenylacetate-CoA oxygenase subunit PaaJ [Phaeocystidibacter marisrubri]
MFSEEEIRGFLQDVTDPEIPVLTILDMGVVRRIHWEGEALHIDITPTYTGCPAMDVIANDIVKRLKAEGVDEVFVKEVLSPAWTTDWLSEDGRRKLEEYGIAPPVDESADKRALFGAQPTVRCPQCKSENTSRISQFGSTACKALYQCNDCKEPFDYFKCL